jgi:hypothetical protein
MRVISLAVGVGALLVGAAAGAQTVKQVEVTNLPATQNVDGAVEVTNLPAVQDVSVVGGCPASPFQLVGFTSATFDGGQGVFTYTAACQAEFPGSRFCTSEEVLNTVSVPLGLSGDAWVRPVFVPFGMNAGGMIVLDTSGRDHTGLSRLSCFGWSPGGGLGLIVSAVGGFSFGHCGTPRAVACCGAPQ